MPFKQLLKIPYFFIGMLLLLAVWQMLFLIGGHPAAEFPPPHQVGSTIMQMIADRTLFIHLGVSLGRFLAGYCMAVIPAVLLGILLGTMPIAWKIVDPIVQVLRPVSPVAWSPFVLLWFGIGNMPAITIISIAAFFPVLLLTVAGVRKIDHAYLNIAKNMEITRRQLLQKIILPASFPNIFTGLRVALGSSWIFLVTGEMIGAETGLGFLIVAAKEALQLNVMIAGIVSIGFCGFLLDRFISYAEFRIGRRFGAAS